MRKPVKNIGRKKHVKVRVVDEILVTAYEELLVKAKIVDKVWKVGYVRSKEFSNMIKAIKNIEDRKKELNKKVGE